MPFGLSAFNPRLTLALTLIVVSTYATLTQIVEPRPNNVAHHIGEVV